MQLTSCLKVNSIFDNLIKRKFHFKFISPQFGAVLQLEMESEANFHRARIDKYADSTIYLVLLEVLLQMNRNINGF